MKNKFRIALLSMAAVGLVGCADKLADDVLQSSQEGVTDGCVTFKINAVGNQTRATEDGDGGFTKGEDYEYAITRDAGANVVFIFDETGKYVSKSDLQIVSDPDKIGDDGHVGENQNHTTKDEELYFNARIRKTKSEDEKTLKCIMILNATPSRLSAFSETLVKSETTIDDFLKSYDEVTPSYNSLGRYGDYFTMSNTVYVDNVSNGTTKEIKGPITISDDNIYSTAQEAAEHPVTVHVERLSAKFSLEVDGNLLTKKDGDVYVMDGDGLYIMLPSTEDEDEGKLVPTKNKWGIRILGWNVNGTETATYWVKNLKTNDNKPVYNEDTGYNIGNWGFEFNGSTSLGWNDPSRVRSYWAVDPHYNGENDRYPQQYRDAKNKEEGETFDNGITGYDYAYNPTGGNALNYISYKAIGTDAISTVRYAPENTFGGYGFMTRSAKTEYTYKGDGYKRASTHILVAAELVFENADESLETFDGYCYENVYWKEDKEGKNKDLISHMAYQVIQEYGKEVFVDVAGAKKRIDDGVDYNDYFEFITNTTPSVETNGATIKGGDGRVMLKLKSSAHLFLKKADGSGEYEEISEDELNKNFQKAIYTAGTAKHYNQGKMYYAIPIEHMAKMYKESDKTKEDYGELYYNIGSFGVVRNHWYQIKITDIKVTGVPVDDPDQPIIPNDDPDEGGYIAFEIVIVPWHVINQEVSFE